MSVSSPLVLIGATVLAGGILARAFWRNRTIIGPLPPGPKSYPLIGQLLSIPQGDEYIAYKKMCEDLGSDIISLSGFGMTVVVLNNREDAINLLDKRSAIYSSRTLPVVLSDSSLLDWSKLGTLILYGDRWKLYRRLMSPWATRNGANTFRHAQKREASLFVYRFLKRSKGPISSENLESELLLGLGAMFFRSIYGYEVKSLDDSFLVGVQPLFDYVEEACLPSRYWVNAIPTLKYVPSWFPGAGWKRQVENWRKIKDSLVQDLYELATNHVNGRNDKPTIVSSLVEEALRLGLSQEQADDYVQQIAITLHAGGSETTVNTLLMFFMAMLLYPEVQSKAQKELDSVLGDTRLPTFEDQSELGYVSRVVQEILRWQPVTPIAFPHTSLEKDIYKGYHIPAGTVVISNVWAMTQDPNTYADPETFEPDRFLDPSILPSPLFGWGRRHCPGSHIAEEALFIFIASILCTFDIKAPKDENGNDVLPTRKMLSDNAIVLHPEPFDFLLRPRSAKREDFIVDLAAEIRSE